MDNVLIKIESERIIENKVAEPKPELHIDYSKFHYVAFFDGACTSSRKE